MRRALAAVALLAIACGGLFYNQGNGFPCDFNAAEEVRDKACAPTEVCSVLNRCERFVYEGPQFEGTPQLPDFDAGRKIHPLVLDRPVTAVTANASTRDEFVVVLAADGGTARSVSVQLGRLVLLKDTALNTTGLREVAVAREGFGATLNATQFPTLFDGTMITSPAKTLRAGVDTLGLLRGRLANNNVTAGTLDSADFCTASGLACNDATKKCTACGGPGEPCCDNILCNAGGCCDQNSKTCVGAGGTCPGAQGTCTAAGCMNGTCGKVGQACCAGGVECTAPFTDCGGANTTCRACGGLGQSCCPGNRGGDTCASPFACTKGTCTVCGGAGQPCCAGDVCNVGKTCDVAGNHLCN